MVIGGIPMIRHTTPILLLAALTACAQQPLSPERAEVVCEDRAIRATEPRGEISVGVNGDGKVSTGIAIGVTTDLLRGRDPDEVFDECYRDKTGGLEPPERGVL